MFLVDPQNPKKKVVNLTPATKRISTTVIKGVRGNYFFAVKSDNNLSDDQLLKLSVTYTDEGGFEYSQESI